MRTLSSIVAEETAEREKARAYEVAKNEVSEAKLRIERLAIAPDAATIDTLRKIAELANALPKDCIGSVGGLMPVAGEARTFIHALAASALHTLVSKDQHRQEQLKKEQAALVRAEEAFKEFE